MHKSFKPTIKHILEITLFICMVFTTIVRTIIELFLGAIYCCLWILLAGSMIIIYIPTLGWSWSIFTKYNNLGKKITHSKFAKENAVLIKD